MNEGKIFESQWKKSIPDYALLYRLPDSAQSFGGGNLRFSAKNPFDYLLWDSNSRTLYALELKTVKGKSISFERKKEDTGVIHYHQIVGLNKWNAYNGTVCGIVVEFRGIETTIFLDIEGLNRLIDVIPKKSFNFDDLEKYEIHYVVIPQKKLRARYVYDVDSFLSGQIGSKSNDER